MRLDDLSFFGDYFHPKRIEGKNRSGGGGMLLVCLSGNSHTEKKIIIVFSFEYFPIMEKHNALGQLKQQPAKPANR